MAKRRYITLSDEAAKIYDALPYGEKGDHVSRLICEEVTQRAAFPPLPPAGLPELTRDYWERWLRWQAAQGQ